MKRTKDLLPSLDNYITLLEDAYTLCKRVECRRCPLLSSTCPFTELSDYHRTLKNTLKAKSAKLDEEDRHRQAIIYF